MHLNRDAILGQIALERGLVTEAQLRECTQAQFVDDEADPHKTISSHRATRPLGVILLARGFVKEPDLISLIEEQNRRVRLLEEYRKMVKVDLLLGELLVKHDKATQIQVNKCLDIQESMVSRGTAPIPRLGELMVEHGYVDPATVQEILRLQNKEILICTRCRRQFNVVGTKRGAAYRCKMCGGIMILQSDLQTLRADETRFEGELNEAGE